MPDKKQNIAAGVDAEVNAVEAAERSIVDEVEARGKAATDTKTPTETQTELSVAPESRDASALVVNDTKVKLDDIESKIDSEAKADKEIIDAAEARPIETTLGEKVMINGLAKPYKTDADPIGGKAISGEVFVVDGEISRGRVRVYQAGGEPFWINTSDLEDE
jgi:hypothetical protein